ncbi:MAG TPA: sigma 54-interacting transcriptional regulator, partial [Gemmatimonas sp.]|nr:sigma 54-interacting transcriptional regulator [Gemmatimonas sp.]
RFELAGRGTIFLDEIGDTSPDFQAKLLRVLQEREFYPVGAERPERTEARVLAATHRNLEEQIERGAFRADLYYRLRVIEIRIPPLRERRGDIPLLAGHLMRTLSAAMHRSVPTLTDEAIQLLGAYDWPGNVRELENVLTAGLVVARGDVIHRDHLLIAGRQSAAVAILEPLDTIERVHVERVLAATGGRKAESARILGVSRPRLDRLLTKHGLH